MNNPITSPGIFKELRLINELVFAPCGIDLTAVEAESESREYLAHNFKLNGQHAKFRKAKITPTKTGQFVTIWKRNAAGVTVPFDIADDIDFFIIATTKEERSGFFILPKQVLHEKGILSDTTKDGKRGMRVYSPWDITENRQAQKTQQWQTNYFIDLSEHHAIDMTRAKYLTTSDKSNYQI